MGGTAEKLFQWRGQQASTAGLTSTTGVAAAAAAAAAAASRGTVTAAPAAAALSSPMIAGLAPRGLSDAQLQHFSEFGWVIQVRKMTPFSSDLFPSVCPEPVLTSF
jgi:hypothetical protein